jgi:hypothetical protein
VVDFERIEVFLLVALRATINLCHKTIGRLVLANTTSSFALLRSKLNELFIEMGGPEQCGALEPRLAGGDVMKKERPPLVIPGGIHRW